MLTLLDRYIVKKLLDYLFLGIVVFTLVLFFSDALLDLMKDLQHYGIPMDIALTIIGLQIPRIVAIIIPMSALLATLMVYNGLNNQFELIAMRMSGISLYRLALPAILIGGLATVGSYMLNDYVVPICNKYARALKSYAINQQNLPATEENFTFKQFDENQQLQRLVYVSHFNGTKLGYSTVIDLTNPDTLQVTQAKGGQWGGSSLILEDASTYTVSNNQKLTNTTFASRMALEHFMRPEKTVSTYQPREMSFWQLAGWLRGAEQQGRRMADEVYVTLWEKLTIPLTALPLVLIAVPLGMTSPRKMNNLGFLSAIFILFLYYLIRHISVQFGENGTVDPLISAMLPLVIITAVATGLFMRRNMVL